MAEFDTQGGKFTFCCGDYAPMMDVKGTVTSELLDMIDDDERVIYVLNDSTGRNNRTWRYLTEKPGRILDVAIQEMNTITICGALASKGYLPYYQTYGPFLTLHALDQVHNDICYNDFPVRLISTHAGVSSGYGPTHNTILDFAMFNAMPNMTMVAPCDAIMAKKMLRASLNYPHPLCIRIPRGEEPNVYTDDTEYEYVFGRSITIAEGSDITLIATGSMVYQSVQAARILEEKGYDVGVIDMHTISPIDVPAILHAARHSNAIMTVEDHCIDGGLGTIVGDVLAQGGVATRFKKVGLPSEFSPYAYPEELYPHYKMDGPGIAENALKLMLNLQ